MASSHFSAILVTRRKDVLCGAYWIARANTIFRAGLKMPVDVYEGPAMNHSYHEMIIGHGGCFSTIVVAETAEKADYHRAQYLATQMALAERGRAVVSITLRDLEDGSLRALDEFFRQAATLIRRTK